jgi:hypothetical protein
MRVKVGSVRWPVREPTTTGRLVVSTHHVWSLRDMGQVCEVVVAEFSLTRIDRKFVKRELKNRWVVALLRSVTEAIQEMRKGLAYLNNAFNLHKT